MEPKYALHEALDVHELAAFKALCLTKAKTMQMLVTDPELKALMQADVATTTRQIQELQALLTAAQHEGVVTP